MGSDAADGRCQMSGCTRPAARTMTFERHDDVAVCDAHYKRNVAIKYAVLAGVSLVLVALVLGVYWLL